ncbi:hypothetical protein AGMMS50293_26050 [Spirochaetia bacterium]|nr:hypothetical protein AGMMS50293_26050 [Spirochaetia bacterium]
MRSTAAIMNEGINILLQKMGVLETEEFISTLLKESFDYTEWRREHYTDIDIDPNEFNRMAVQFDKNNPL